ncbi:MAG: hypothetical protein M1817_003271 [Caeruleum heppii]|nr:MAG: hypothetical protein M1817_003271 [Caeruleum heppii]
MLKDDTPNPRKRRRSTDERRKDLPSPPAKKTKSSLQTLSHDPYRPPGYWDTLSKVWLTRGSLREFDRRNEEIGPCQPPSASTRANRQRRSSEWDIKRFARRGGPDLTHLRGLAATPPAANDAMSKSKSRKGKKSSPSEPTDNSRSSPYSRDFEQKLFDEGIRLNDRGPKPHNWAEFKDFIARERSSLSPSQFSDGAFEDFREDSQRALREADVMARVVSTIAGSSDRRHISNDNVIFNNMEKFVEGQLTAAQPDRFYGVRPECVHQSVRSDLQSHIIPSTDATMPVVPNFFLEAKSAAGRPDVARRQICHDLAIGARAMHRLQHYGTTRSTYDGNAYTIGTAYHSGTGTLQILTTHPVRPASPRVKPEYHIAQVRSYVLTNDADAFREGARAYRNARDWAQCQRSQFIATANAKAEETPEGASASIIDDLSDRSAANTSTVQLDVETPADDGDLGRDSASKRRRLDADVELRANDVSARREDRSSGGGADTQELRRRAVPAAPLQRPSPDRPCLGPEGHAEQGLRTAPDRNTSLPTNRGGKLVTG